MLSTWGLGHDAVLGVSNEPWPYPRITTLEPVGNAGGTVDCRTCAAAQDGHVTSCSYPVACNAGRSAATG